MIYLSGVPHPCVAELPNCGYLITQQMGNRPKRLPQAPWAADNGCYRHPERFDMVMYLSWLDNSMAYARRSCLFAVAPDVPMDAGATLARSLPALPVIRSLGYPVAFAAQDGMLLRDLPWGAFDWLFIGGSTVFKLGDQAQHMAREAQRRQVRIHVGRVNSLRRLLFCRDVLHADSCDGTFLAPAPDYNARRLKQYLVTVRSQPVLFTEEVS